MITYIKFSTQLTWVVSPIDSENRIWGALILQLSVAITLFPIVSGIDSQLTVTSWGAFKITGGIESTTVMIWVSIVTFPQLSSDVHVLTIL